MFCHFRQRPTQRSSVTHIFPTGCEPEPEPSLSSVQASTSDTFSSIHGRNGCHDISESII